MFAIRKRGYVVIHCLEFGYSRNSNWKVSREDCHVSGNGYASSAAELADLAIQNDYSHDIEHIDHLQHLHQSNRRPD